MGGRKLMPTTIVSEGLVTITRTKIVCETVYLRIRPLPCFSCDNTVRCVLVRLLRTLLSQLSCCITLGVSRWLGCAKFTLDSHLLQSKNRITNVHKVLLTWHKPAKHVTTWSVSSYSFRSTWLNTECYCGVGHDACQSHVRGLLCMLKRGRNTTY
jgi:hypothetical protein